MRKRELINNYGIRTGIVKEGKYITRRNKEKHYFRKYKGYGISTNILHKLSEMNINKIILIEETQEGENRLETRTEEIWARGIRYTHKQADHQIILPKKYWLHT